jgi:CxxC motif-containing protein (DUF1111 family)
MKFKLTIMAMAVVGITGCGSDHKTTTDTPDIVDVVQYPDYTDVVALGGETTDPTVSNSGHGFSSPIPTLTGTELSLHLEGDLAFETVFTTAPNNDHPDLDGLGPVFNNQDCNSCHQRDGRPSTLSIPAGQQALKLGSEAGIFLRISLDTGQCIEQTAANDYCAPVGVPGFGTQLFHRGILKARHDWQQNMFGGQADVYLSYEYSEVKYADGETITLKKPKLTIRNPYDSAMNGTIEDENTVSPTSALLQDNVLTGARNGMPVFGLGLLESITEQDILALADEQDSNNDGISGKPNWVFDKIEADAGVQTPVSLGRFGWKANTPTVRHQSLGALRGDIGITNPLFPNESIANTVQHEDYMQRTDYQDTGVDIHGETEADEAFADSVTFYSETLAIPARRNVDAPETREGARQFTLMNCTGCHTPSFTTGEGMTIGGKPQIASLANQKIYPFTDMLLHDMGDDLADGRPDFLATGHEWKTRPLWGLGLTKTVNPGAGFLHDGRAETVEEAILWHGGEAQASREAFRTADKASRDALVSFLMSL